LVTHASGKLNARRPTSFDEAQLVSKTNGTAGLNVDIIESYQSPSQ
jgi:hypothetical protein